MSCKEYEDIIFEAGIASAGLVKGTLFIHPKGCHIWESIQRFMDGEFRAIGIKNVSFPSLIPLSEMEKEKENLSGFRPELFLVSRSGDEEKPSIFLRPTSEILFSHFFKRELTSYTQLPFLFNQWCNIYRSEKNTKAFLRGCEFYWQEAHTLHANEEESMDYLNKFHRIYQKMILNVLNLAFLSGEKTVNERFKGALKTLSIEVVMPDGQALQVATSHYLGRNFSEIFKVTYTDNTNSIQHPYQLSAGSSTRLLGALIMGHRDELGLVLPFKVADVQIKILIIGEVIKKDDLTYQKIDRQLGDYAIEWELFSKKSLGFRLSDAEVLGVPIVIVIGEKEIKTGRAMVKSRISKDKHMVDLDDLGVYIEDLVEGFSKELYLRSSNKLSELVVDLRDGTNLEMVKNKVLDEKKVVLVPWFDDGENERKFTDEKFGFGPRCVKERIAGKGPNCFYSGAPANAYVYFGRSY